MVSSCLAHIVAETHTWDVPMLPIFPEFHICCCETVSPFLIGILPTTEPLLTLALALNLDSICCLVPAHTMNISRACCGPTIPSDIVCAALWTFGKFGKVERVYDGEGFEICQLWLNGG